MAEKEFRLPISSLNEIKKIMIAYAKSKNPCSLADANRLTGIHRTIISANNGFLDSIKAIQGGNSKEATTIGKRLGLAFANNIESEISSNLKLLLSSNEFIESMITSLEIKPRTSEDFQSHIAYSLGKEHKGTIATGTGTLIELLEMGKVIEEREGLLYPKVHSKNDDIVEIKATEIHNQLIEKDGGNTSITKHITSNLGSNVTLNINIQLTIPETENEKVYESFFEAMKKHLLT